MRRHGSLTGAGDVNRGTDHRTEPSRPAENVCLEWRGRIVMNARTLAIVACGIVGLTRGVDGQGLSQYRNFALGSDVASVAALASVDPADAKTIHQRPAVLQDLEWRPSRWVAGSN